MNISLHIHEALGNLTSSKLRSFLAVLGILVGTASVVAMVSSGQLATQQALAQFKKLGTDLLSVSMFSQNQGGGGDKKSAAKPQQLTLPEAMGIKGAVKGVSIVAPYITGYAPMVYKGKTISGSALGVTQSLKDVIRIKMQMGRFISFLDGPSYFVVIGQGIYKQIKALGGLNPIGQQLKIGKSIFTIIGVADQWTENSFFNQDINNSVMVTEKIGLLLSKYAKINNIILRLDKDANIDDVKTGITSYIHGYVGSYKLFFRSAEELIKSMQSQRQILTLLLAAIGSISLLVGGIGVMNIMLVSVVERRREIGIRKAVGARRKDIQSLFLVEAIILALFGGLLGVITGVLTSFLIALFAGWHFTLFFLPPAIGFVVSVAVGIFFGFYPAYRASRLDPIQTLRSD